MFIKKTVSLESMITNLRTSLIANHKLVLKPLKVRELIANMFDYHNSNTMLAVEDGNAFTVVKVMVSGKEESLSVVGGEAAISELIRKFESNPQDLPANIKYECNDSVFDLTPDNFGIGVITETPESSGDHFFNVKFWSGHSFQRTSNEIRPSNPIDESIDLNIENTKAGIDYVRATISSDDQNRSCEINCIHWLNFMDDDDIISLYENFECSSESDRLALKYENVYPVKDVMDYVEIMNRKEELNPFEAQVGYSVFIEKTDLKKWIENIRHHSIDID
jgi:hypothetical protein